MRGGSLGKFIMLSFDDNVDDIFIITVIAFVSITAFSTLVASADAPLFFGSPQITPQHRLVRHAEQLIELTPMGFDNLLLLARWPRQVFSSRYI